MENFENTMKRAQEFAARAHAGQEYGGHSYTFHLAQVVAVLDRFGFRADDPVPAKRDQAQDLIIAGWLHDVVEDTSVTSEEVAAEFGATVAALVVAVTNEPGANRKERAAKTYPKIRAAGESAVALKLADRIANVESCLADSKLGMYKKEAEGFRSVLRKPGEWEEMWLVLEKLVSQ